MSNYSFREKADMIFMYGLANGNSTKAAELYRESFPNRQQPSNKMFSKLYQQLIETGTVTSYIFREGRPFNIRNEEEDSSDDDDDDDDEEEEKGVSSIQQQCSGHMTASRVIHKQLLCITNTDVK